jgi:hypothetical protein
MMMTRRVPLATGALLACMALAGATGARAQAVVHPLLPDSVAERVVALYNLEPTTRLTGDARIGAGSTVRGSVALLAGRLTVEGTIDGDVVVINGDLHVLPGGSISGSATVVGGDIAPGSAATVAGGVAIFREPLRFRYQGNAIIYIPAEMERGLSAGVNLPFGRTDILVASHGAYNRVEGLPVAVGPRIRFGGTHPTTAQALLIARTAAASELDPRRFGYDLRAEQLVAPGAGLTLGLRLFSEVAPIEEWGVSDRESALATFVLHRDYRDHYEREGWGLFARMRRPGTPYTLTAEYRDEEHESRRPSDPFTLLDNDGPWRAQPSIAEGALRSVAAVGSYDTRNEDRDPSAGWLVHLELERGLGGGIRNPVSGNPPGEGALRDEPRVGRTGYLSAHADVRRYARLTPYSRLALRVLAAGSLDARPLPPQRQHTLGGEGSLPGYSLFAFDCGARVATFARDGHPFYPYYGCDRIALVQIEYQANFPYARRLAESAGVAGHIGHLVRWVAFFDAGRAWNERGSADGRLGGEPDFSADAGLGLRVGPLGAYWAVPLSGRGQNINFFLRLDPRI